ncbi:hypothetical protein ACTXG7_24805 [Mycolicibacterium sp. Dal123E01]|uniref:hypothetical protein n=1 Tax=Mycolicibacterium sp. Dal123E01 TaxID=3457578 RepID=UPI00403ED0EC
MAASEKTNWAMVGGVAAVVGVVVAVVAIVVAHVDSQGGGTTSPPSVSSSGTSTWSAPSTDRVDPPPPSTPNPTQDPPTIQPQPAPEPPARSTPSATAPPAPTNTIDAVYVTVGSGNGLILKKGDVFELQPTYPSSINPPFMTFRWESQGAGGKVSGDCNVAATINGPGDYPQRRRDGACSGRVSSDLKIMEPGTYTVAVDVTPPDGGAIVSGSSSFTVVPHGG